MKKKFDNQINEPLVSIITPTYNHQNYIAQCIQSVLKQEYDNWEMIIINDGSTDTTAEIAKNFVQQDDRIKLINQENVGIYRLHESYNKALSLAKGKYIAILEADDYWYPQKLKLQVQNFEENPDAVMSFTTIHSKVEDSTDILRTYPDANNVDINWICNKPNCSVINVFLKTVVPPVGWMIRKQPLDKIGGFSQSPHIPAVDISTAMQLARLGNFIFVEEPLGVWRMHKSQVTKNLTSDMTLGTEMFVKELFDSFNAKEKENSQLAPNTIEKMFKIKRIISLSRSGRFKLIRKDYKSARIDYWKSIILYGLTLGFDWKIRSLIGLIASIFHTDVEVLAKKFGKGALK